MNEEYPNSRAARLDAQARVLVAKLNEPGRNSLQLGPESTELVSWMVERGWVDVDDLGPPSLVIRAKKRDA